MLHENTVYGQNAEIFNIKDVLYTVTLECTNPSD
jgi:hypothetical protein